MLDMMFSIAGAFVVRASSKERVFSMLQIQPMFFKFEPWLRREESARIVNEDFLGSVRLEIQRFQELMRETFDAPCEPDL